MERPRSRLPAPASRPPEEIRAVTPPIAQTDGKASRDWNKLVGKIYERDYREALKKLGEWERKYGEVDETRELRGQLEPLAAADPDGGGKRGKRGKRGD
ncbi:MAG: hypothetical protein ABI867_25475 [Kofleriaceae bacterium]